MSVHVHLAVDDADLEGKFLVAGARLPRAVGDGTERVAAKGAELARGMAPVRVGYLREGITYRRTGLMSSETYVREGMPPEPARFPGWNTAGGPGRGDGYSTFMEYGFRPRGAHRQPFMGPAADTLRAGIAETIMNQEVWGALQAAGLDAGFSGLL